MAWSGLWLGVALGCAGPARPERGSPVDACRNWPSEPVALAAPEPPARPSSRIALELVVGTERLQRELAQAVPSELAAGRRDVGVAGTASYRVTRGAFAIDTVDGAVRVQVPVRAHVEVCKPVGPFCPVYGTCDPTLVAEVRVPLLLGRNYRIGPAAADVGIGRGCVLDPVGVDVTPDLERAARTQIRAVEQQVNAALPEFEPSARALWKLFATPLALGPSTCVRISPSDVRTAPPRLAGAEIAVRLGVLGRLDVEQPCEARTPRTLALPTPVEDNDLPAGVALEVPIALSWAEVSAELTRALTRTTQRGRHDVTHVRAAPHRVDGHDVVALTLGVEGCGEVTLLGEPVWNAGSARLGLERVRYASGQPERVRVLAELDLEARVERLAAVALPVDLASARTALDELVGDLTRDRPEGVLVTTALSEATVRSVLVEPDALVPVASLQGSVRVLAR